MKCQGMSLLEVMVALAIFASAAGAIVRMLGEQVSGITALEESTFASWVADNQMVSVRLSTSWPNLSGQAGEERMAGKVWYWRWRGRETADPQFRALDVEVRDSQDAAAPRASLRSYFTRQ